MAAYASERDTPGLRAAAHARRGEAEQASSPTPTRTRRIHEPSLNETRVHSAVFGATARARFKGGSGRGKSTHAC